MERFQFSFRNQLSAGISVKCNSRNMKRIVWKSNETFSIIRYPLTLTHRAETEEANEWINKLTIWFDKKRRENCFQEKSNLLESRIIIGDWSFFSFLHRLMASLRINSSRGKCWLWYEKRVLFCHSEDNESHQHSNCLSIEDWRQHVEWSVHYNSLFSVIEAFVVDCEPEFRGESMISVIEFRSDKRMLNWKLCWL